jgi:DNA-binding response OmpR family regulator
MPACFAESRSAIMPMVRHIGPSLAAPLRVLLVEDSAEAAHMIRAYLTQNQDDLFDVEWMPNLLDAMFRLQHPGIDAVLLDLGLPELKGYKSFRAIDGMTEGKIPIVILTADDRPVSRDLTLASGAAGYLIKQQTSAAQLRQTLRYATVYFDPGNT